MQSRTLFKLLAGGVVGGLALRAVVHTARERRARRRWRENPDLFARDPTDPLQGLDEVSELQGTPLDVDVQSLVEAAAAQDLAMLEIDVDETADDDAAIEEGQPVELPPRLRDAGDLYGAHTPAAADRLHPDDDQAFVEGQNWIEALETSAIEGGPEPEQPLEDIIDDQDVLRPPHASHTRDTPVADYGSGGRRGL